jgi:UDP-N-acetyl-D-glucosamine dehydrogenase
LVLGAAYKPDVDDLRESPALDIIGLLEKKGVRVSYHDPYIAHLRHEGWEFDSVSDLMSTIKSVDCVVIVTNHQVYDYAAILETASLIVDTRNALGEAKRKNQKVFSL